MDILALIAALFLVALNGFFVATEFAIVKVRPTRIEELIQKNRPGAAVARKVIANIDGYLSATQLGITFASLGLGWIGEPAFARLLEIPLDAIGINDPTLVHTIAITFAFITISFLHIVVGELAPKSLAIMHAESTALVVAYPIRLFYFIFFPAIWALNGLANFLLRMLGVKSTLGENDHHSEEEIRIILSQARSAGLLGAARSEVLAKALSLPTKNARHLMVPRNEVLFLDINLSLEENLKRAMESGHRRFPLCDRELDEVVGIIDIRDVLYFSRKSDVEIHTLAKPTIYFPEMMSAERLLAEFQKRRLAMAIIVDEYGGASGIVTAGDIVASILGELDEPLDNDVIELPGGAYDVDGTAPIDEVEEALHTKFESKDMRTIAGFLMEKLGRMPRIGDRITENGLSFYVMDVNGPKVKRIRIRKLNSPSKMRS
jgi:CBS domain containing-hemolysin-like protein